MANKKSFIIAALVSLCLTVALFATMSSRSSPAAGEYDPFKDINDDGKVNILDLVKVAGGFGGSGAPAAKALIKYDSGWVNITDKAGQYFNVTHNLNVTDWNDMDLVVEITGKTTLEGGLLRRLGLKGHKPGWIKTYGEPGSGEAWSVVQTVDEGYAIAGTTGYPNAAWMVKTDANGNMQWNKTYEGPGLGYCVVQTVDEGYAIVGGFG